MLVRESINIFENVQQAKSVLKKNNIPETDRRYVELKQMLEDANKIGYLGSFTKWMAGGAPLEELKDLFQTIQTTGVKNIPPIDTFKSAMDMYDTIRSLETQGLTGNLIKLIPSNARRVLDTPELRQFIIVNKKNADDIKRFFLKSSGGFADHPQDFLPTLETFVANLNGEWNLKTMYPKVKAFDDVKIFYKSPELLIFTISDFETSKKLCSQEFCIATNRSHFDSYVDTFNNQFLIYDFTKKPSDVRSIIGATIQPSNTDEINIREMMFRNNHSWYYPNHPQPTGYSHTKMHDPAIAVKDYMEELLKEIEPNV